MCSEDLRHARSIQFAWSDKLVAFHGDSYFVFLGIIRFLNSKHLAQAADANGRRVSGQRDHVLNSSANVDAVTAQKTHPTRTDVARLLGPADLLLPNLQDLQRKLKLVPLCATLFQTYTLVVSISGIKVVWYWTDVLDAAELKHCASACHLGFVPDNDFHRPSL
jgi:hypothetical protein